MTKAAWPSWRGAVPSPEGSSPGTSAMSNVTPGVQGLSRYGSFRGAMRSRWVRISPASVANSSWAFWLACSSSSDSANFVRAFDNAIASTRSPLLTRSP